MAKKIVKAEILFSRKCYLSCSYCAMVDGRDNSRTVDEWKMGINQLSKLGCEFIAFYGAEPLAEFDKLVEVIDYCENKKKIDTTVITSGAVPNFWRKIKELHSAGLKSLSMSYDPNPSDNSSVQKSRLAKGYLEEFLRFPGVRDAAAIATITAKNFKYLPDMVETMSKCGIWTFFDFIHENRGQPGSKCGPVSDDLKLKKTHYKDLVEVLDKVKWLKFQGKLCHTSTNFIDIVKANTANNDLYGWTCHYMDPAWITIDCDGRVSPCDDFNGVDFYDMLGIYKEWENFCKHCRESIEYHECKCCWNTHIDAQEIISGSLNINEYVHGRK